jgi:Sigma-70 region 2
MPSTARVPRIPTITTQLAFDRDAPLLAQSFASGLRVPRVPEHRERHHVLAFSLAARIVGSQDGAQEIVQDAFLNLWRDAGRYDPTRGLVRTWLMSMVHDRGIDSTANCRPATASAQSRRTA